MLSDNFKDKFTAIRKSIGESPPTDEDWEIATNILNSCYEDDEAEMLRLMQNATELIINHKENKQ